MITSLTTITDERLELAAGWYDGAGSMLYAIASTGSMSRGSARPTDDGAPLGDAAWDRSLLERLASELREVERLARLDDPGDVRVARRWAHEVEAELDALGHGGCDGLLVRSCGECGRGLCGCEAGYGHDCEV